MARCRASTLCSVGPESRASWGERTLQGGGQPEEQPTPGSGQILISKLNYPSKSGLSPANVQWGKSSFPGNIFSALTSICHHRASSLAPAWPLSFGYNSEIVPWSEHHPQTVAHFLVPNQMSLPASPFSLWNTVSATSIKHNEIFSFLVVTTENGS